MSNVLNKEKIHWYSYSNEALEKAKEQNKSIFLFIHSSSSKWSQKMQEESLLESNVIELLNERFIPIMVNKDERPDIERYYHKVYTLMNRQKTGSPLSLFLTANLEPFYAASYIPIEDIDDQLSLESLLRIISKKYITDYETLVKKGQEVLSHMHTTKQNIQATKLSLNVLTTITQHVNTLLDPHFGGFTKAPKFPNPSTLELLLDLYLLEKNSSILNAITLTLDQMAKGGFYDLENGGFYTYTQDEEWEKPYEVKTVYDNAQLIHLYLRAYNITQNQYYKEVAFKTIDFMLSLQQENKLFTVGNEKIILSYNSLMVQALFIATNIDVKYKVIAFETLDAILSVFYVSGTLYHHNEEPVKAFLEDYSSLGETLVLAYQNSLDESFLIMATQFANLLIEQYYEQAKWVYSNNDFKVEEHIYDTNTPSSIASVLSLLLSISSLVDNNYKKFVFKTLELHSFNLMRQPLSSPKLTHVMLRYLKDDIIIESNENLLKNNIFKREKISYPYLYFKTTQEESVKVTNSHSTLKTEKTFAQAQKYIESL